MGGGGEEDIVGDTVYSRLAFRLGRFGLSQILLWNTRALAMRKWTVCLRMWLKHELVHVR
jgi:hypothetical protein